MVTLSVKLCAQDTCDTRHEQEGAVIDIFMAIVIKSNLVHNVTFNAK